MRREHVQVERGLVGMRLLTFRDGDGLHLGLKTDAGVIDVAKAGDAFGVTVPATIGEAFSGGGRLSELAAKADGASGGPWLLDEGSLTFGPVVPDPGKIICIGLNYRKHAEESGAPIPSHPVIFSKFNNTLAGHNEKVPLPSVGEQYDYEVDLCVVIGKTARGVSEADALNYVYGYCSANDVSVRELQTRTSQWLLGKTMDKFFPIGPYLVTADEVGDPQKLQCTTKVNGELRQNS